MYHNSAPGKQNISRLNKMTKNYIKNCIKDYFEKDIY